MNLHHFFDEVITSEEVGFGKPHKRIFEKAMDKMNCEAENSIMVGDKYEIDIEGAIDSGMSAILVNSTMPEEKNKR